MNGKYFKSLTGLILLVSLYACIEEYNPSGVEQVRDLLVVEGVISNGTTTIKLSRSIGLEDDFSDLDYIANGTMWVESNDGSKSSLSTHITNGVYEIPTGELDPAKEYSLRISVDGREYQSGYLAPVYTPEIDSIYWLKKEEGAPVRMCVATHDDKQQSHYYRWSYKENWEVRSSYIATVVLEGVEEVRYDTSTPNNIYACWGQDSSRVLLLGSTEKLAEYRLPQKELLEMEPTDSRLSVLYHIDVEQMQLRREAYLYYYNLQKNIESGSGLFAPMPTEMRGNIRNINDPDEIVIGYVEVTTITRMEKYIDVRDGAYEYPRSNCRSTTDAEEAYEFGYEMYDQDTRDTYFAPRSCFDCRTFPKATKNKPSWWPTDWPI